MKIMAGAFNMLWEDKAASYDLGRVYDSRSSPPRMLARFLDGVRCSR